MHRAARELVSANIQIDEVIGGFANEEVRHASEEVDGLAPFDLCRLSYF